MKKSQLLLALLALTTGVLAQDQNPAAPANAAKLALARETISAMHADTMFDNMAAQMKQMAGQMVQLPRETTPEQRKKAEELQGKIMDLSMTAAKGMVAKMDEVYASVYSEAELRAMKTFFTSPEGQSMMSKQSQIMAQIMPLVQQMQRDLMPKIKQLVDEAKAADKPAQAPAPDAKAPAAPASGK